MNSGKVMRIANIKFEDCQICSNEAACDNTIIRVCRDLRAEKGLKDDEPNTALKEAPCKNT